MAFPVMRRILGLSMLVACYALGDDASERAAIRQAIKDAAPHLTTASPTVQISREPWGEATIQLPPAFATGIAIGSIQFITSDVALADTVAQNRALLFVMRKESGTWKIASVRIMGAVPEAKPPR
jgi:hypothetical protein